MCRIRSRRDRDARLSIARSERQNVVDEGINILVSKFDRDPMPTLLGGGFAARLRPPTLRSTNSDVGTPRIWKSPSGQNLAAIIPTRLVGRSTSGRESSRTQKHFTQGARELSRVNSWYRTKPPAKRVGRKRSWRPASSKILVAQIAPRQVRRDAG